jgi:hypothetical protein
MRIRIWIQLSKIMRIYADRSPGIRISIWSTNPDQKEIPQSGFSKVPGSNGSETLGRIRLLLRSIRQLGAGLFVKRKLGAFRRDLVLRAVSAVLNTMRLRGAWIGQFLILILL